MTAHHRRRPIVAAAIALAAAGVARADILKYDASGNHPASPTNGSGTWGGPATVWSNGIADVPWADGNAADIGDARGSTAYTLTLANDISTAGITVTGPATGVGASYTFNAAGYTLSSPADEVNISAVPVTLTNGTFAVGTAAAPTDVAIGGGATLTLGPAAVVVAAGLTGDSASANVVFAGGTLRPTNPDLPDLVLLGGTTKASVGGSASTGGLTVDTSLNGNGTSTIVDPLTHLSTLTTADGGLTKVGTGTLSLISASSYTGPTAVLGGTLSLGVANAPTGTVANTNYNVAGGTLLVAAANALLGTDGTSTTTVTLGPGGTLTTANGVSSTLGTVTLAGGTLTAGTPAVTALGTPLTFEVAANAQLHATANSTLSVPDVVLDANASLAVNGGATLAVTGTFVDKYAGTASAVSTALTVLGPGTVDLRAVQPYTGLTVVSAGTLLLDVASPPTGVIANGTVRVLSGGKLVVAATNALGGTGATYAGAPVNVSTNGVLSTAAGVSTVAGYVTLQGGTLAAATPVGPDGSFDFFLGSTLAATQNSTASAADIVMPGGSQVNVSAGTLTVTGSFGNDAAAGTAGLLTKTGAGGLTLSAADPYAGPTVVSAGTLTVAAAGSLTGTPSVTVAAGATFNAAGAITSTPAVTVNGTATFAGSPVTLSSLTIGSAGHVAAAATAGPSVRSVLVAGSLSVAAGGVLDLSDNDAVVRNANVAAVTGLLGTGVTSSAAIANLAQTTTLGVIQAPAATTFDGIAVTPTDVLVKYTYYGDANLDGKVDGADYARIDAGFASGGTLTGWYNGDFNYDGKVDASDYTLIDNAFDVQAGSFSPNTVMAVATDEVAAVPEPTAIGLLGVVVLLGRRPGGR